MHSNEKVCGCPHHKMVPALVVIFGLVFLLRNLDVLSSSTVDIVWPIIVGVAGLTTISNCSCC